MPNTRRSHLLIAHAARAGRQAAVKDRVMRAYFEEGCDIGDVEELVRLGVEAGLPERESRSALILRAGQDGVVAAERHATVLGITGVPTFIFDGQYTLSGAQEVATFAQVFDQVADLAAARDGARERRRADRPGPHPYRRTCTSRLVHCTSTWRRRFANLRRAALADGFDLVAAQQLSGLFAPAGHLEWQIQRRAARVWPLRGAHRRVAACARERIEAILPWSALPGASRHHWGTDVDLIDRKATPPGYRVQLTPEEFEPGGPFAAAQRDGWPAMRTASGFSVRFAAYCRAFSPNPGISASHRSPRTRAAL